MGDPVRNIYKGRFVAKQKLDAAEARIADLECALGQAELDHNEQKARIALLEAAIRKHRDYIAENEIGDCPEDENLWALLQEDKHK
jgi:multidrug resistance efflux pump